MDLVITDPIETDVQQYHSLISQPHIVEEFSNFAGQTVSETKKEINYWVKNEGETLPHFLRMLKITPDSSIGSYDDSNSEIIGFIANLPAGPVEKQGSGFDTLINFGISKKFEGKGIMTSTLTLTCERLKELGFNISTAFVKPDNYASSRVLEKCGYNLIQENQLGRTYAKALDVDINLFKRSFGLK